MPTAQIGTKLVFGGGNYLKLKAKGDSIHVRILGEPYYDGKHFLKDGDEWSIEPCPRINDGGKCEMCELYFKAIAEMKEAKQAKDATRAKELEKEAGKWKNTVSFYFPVIDRSDETYKIFQTTISIKSKLDAELTAGVDVFTKDFIVTRTEATGADYYTLVRLDSADTKKLTPKEESEIEKYEPVSFLAMIKPVTKKDKEEAENKNPLPWEEEAGEKEVKDKVDF